MRVHIESGVGRKLLIALATLVFLTFTLFPIYWLINSSFKPPNELFRWPPLYLPTHPELVNYREALTQTNVAQQYRNSLVVASVTTATLIALVITPAYAMARYRFAGKNLIVMFFLVAQMLPVVVLLVPLATIYTRLKLINTLWALVITYVITMLPFSVMMMKNFIATVPVELDEAAMVDGCGRIGALFRIVLPTTIPGLVATAIFAFIGAWNELIFAVVFVSSMSIQTLPVGLKALTDYSRTSYGVLLAATVLALVPTLILFSFIQRWLTSGFTSGAVRG